MPPKEKQFSLPRAASRKQCLIYRTLFKHIVASCVVLHVTLSAQSAVSPAAFIVPKDDEIQTATTHPMKYYISLPTNWTSDKRWPVLFAVSAHYPAIADTISRFEKLRDVRKYRFIIITPIVISTDPISKIKDYAGAISASIDAADAAASDNRDFNIRTAFDSAGIRAVIHDVQNKYHGNDKVYISGFSSSTSIAYLFIFTHPELLQGAVINSGVYLGRGVDEEHIPYLNSPGRANLPIKFIKGENDKYNHGDPYNEGMKNWRETKAKLLSYGHLETNFQEEIVKKNNAEHLPSGHNYFYAPILDFCEAIELKLNN